MALSCCSKAAIAAAALFVSADAASAQTLTRIEPHGFYGATVTVEAGVRVFRGLPPTGTMIINPGNKTPLNLTVVNAPPQAVPVIVDDTGSAYFANGGTSLGWGGVGFGGHGRHGGVHGRGHGHRHVAAKPVGRHYGHRSGRAAFR